MAHRYWYCPTAPDADERGYVDIDAHLRYVQEVESRACACTYPILKGMVEEDDVYLRYRVSYLIAGCDRALHIKSHRDYAIDPNNALARLRGNLFHAAVEKAADAGSIVETRWVRPVKVDGKWYLVTGKPDLFFVEGPQKGLIRDYKTVDRIYGELPKKDHVRQLKLYAWLGQEHGFDVTRGELVYVALRNDARPKFRRERVGIQPADTGWVEQRVRMLNHLYGDSPLPPILDLEDQWLCDYCDVRNECEMLALMDGDEPPVGRPKRRAA